MDSLKGIVSQIFVMCVILTQLSTHLVTPRPMHTTKTTTRAKHFLAIVIIMPNIVVAEARGLLSLVLRDECKKWDMTHTIITRCVNLAVISIPGEGFHNAD